MAVHNKNTRIALLTLCLSAALAACGGGGGGGGSNGDTTAPTVSATSPVDGASGITRSSTITATFNEDILASTVSGSSFLLATDTNVSCTVSFDGNTNVASFTPTAPLNLLTEYTATLNTTITDLAGNPLASDFTWRFTTGDGNWGSATTIDTLTSDASQPQVAMDSAGNAMAVWIQLDSLPTNSVYASRYVVGSGWGTPEMIETNDVGQAASPQIVFDTNGNAIAVWQQYDGAYDSIYANRYVPGTGWGSAVFVETDPNQRNAQDARIAMDVNGNAIAVWQQIDSTNTRFNAWFNRYEHGTGWGTAALLESDDFGHAWQVQIGMDGSGNGIAVWAQNDGASYNIYASRYVPGSGWGTPVVIETGGGTAQAPQIAVQSNGNAIAVWSQTDGSNYSIWSNRFVAGTGWGSATLIETQDLGAASAPRIGIDSNGNAIAVWHQYDGIRNNIWANRYIAGIGWGTAELIESLDTDATDPRIAVQNNGHGIAMWKQWDGTMYSAYARRYVAGSGWGTTQLLETENAGDAYDQQITIQNSGNAVAIWTQNNNIRDDIVTNRFE